MEIFEKFKQFLKANEPELVLALGVILISLISFAAGRLSSPDPAKQPIIIEHLQASAFQNIINEGETQESRERKEGIYVASKNSNKYHLPDCSGAKRIAEHNKIWFISKDEAESLGYQPAANCKGL